ncbi:hypothetical protein LCGC14_3069020, partial [marine sediment metagenome]
MAAARKDPPASLDELKQRLSEDKIEYILAQFVDINGSAKVK